MRIIKHTDISLWEAFYWLCRMESFVSAAKALKMSPPVLTKKIQRLEDQCGIRLFQRSTRRVSPTTDALNLLPRIEALLQEIGGLEESFSTTREISGVIRMTTILPLAQRWLLPRLQDFQKIHPRVQFYVHTSDHLIDLIEAQMDLAIRVHTPKGADFVYRKLFPNDLVLCASPNYLKQNPKIKKPHDLAQHKLLLIPTLERARFVKSQLVIKDLKAQQPIVAESGTFLNEVALRDGGVVLRSLWDVAPYFKTGELVQVLKDHPIEPFGDVYAVTPHRKFLPDRVKTFLQFITEK